MIIDKVYLNDVIIHEIHVLERRIRTIIANDPQG